MHNIRDEWQSFCCAYQFDSCCKVMIILTSVMYGVLLKQVHVYMELPASTCTTPRDVDGDDVYFRFGGAILSDMLHKRYKSIKACATKRRNQISQEIHILQSINSKDKVDVPNYLKYRDRGYMYSPVSTLIFIPFFREVDNCVREVVNDIGFKEHGGNLVNVSICTC